MQEHSLLPESTASSVPNPPVSASVVEPAIEDYLDKVLAPLVYTIPHDRRTELRSEMREHLHAAGSARLELGSSPVMAVKETLEQFGSPDTLSQQWQAEWERSLPAPSPQGSMVRSLGVALECYGFALVLNALLAWMAGGSFRLNPYLLFIIWFGVPLVAGVTVGLRAPGHPMRATYCAMAIYYLPMFLLYYVWARTSLLSPVDERSSLTVMFTNTQCISWTILGGTTAGFTSWLQKLGQRWRRLA